MLTDLKYENICNYVVKKMTNFLKFRSCHIFKSIVLSRYKRKKKRTDLMINLNSLQIHLKSAISIYEYFPDSWLKLFRSVTFIPSKLGEYVICLNFYTNFQWSYSLFSVLLYIICEITKILFKIHPLGLNSKW